MATKAEQLFHERVGNLEADNARLRKALRWLVDTVDPNGDTDLEPFFVEPVAEAKAALTSRS